MTSMTVTATSSGTDSTDGIGLCLKVVTGQATSFKGNTASSITVTTPELAITPGHAGGWVYGALGASTGTGPFTAAANTTFSMNTYWSGDTWTYGGFRSTSTTTTSSTTYGATAPTGVTDTRFIALLEIIAASSGSL